MDLIRRRTPAPTILRQDEGAETPAGSGRVNRGFCLEQLTPSQLQVEATVELMIGWLAEMVNARIKRWKPQARFDLYHTMICVHLAAPS